MHRLCTVQCTVQYTGQCTVQCTVQCTEQCLETKFWYRYDSVVDLVLVFKKVKHILEFV